MGSKKHKKHHKSDKRDLSFDERQEKPLKLVLKVGGNSSSLQAPTPPAPVLSPVPHSPLVEQTKPPHLEEQKPNEKMSSGSHSHEKHKKSKKKKKKKSTEKDRHEKKRKHHHHHHHHREHSHERKEKRRREQEMTRSLIDNSDDHNSLPKPVVMDTVAPCERPARDPRTCTLNQKKIKTPLQILLSYLLKKLQLKDPQEFFAWPVTDAIAPGYSSIISHPIDFSSMKKKIDHREYHSLSEFKSDLKLMCDNAMTYNRPDTVYFKAAKRMWHVGQKLMGRDQLMCLKRNLPYMLDLTVEELGFDINDDTEESFVSSEITSESSITMAPEAKKSKVPSSWNYSEPDDQDDDLTPEEILAEAQKAAKAAADRLTLLRPNTKYGFLRQRENGSTTLAVLNPGSGDKVLKVNLEMLAGKLSQGTGTIIGFKEDSKNIIKPGNYINYGAYSSYAPHYDSMFANLSKEESDIVLSTYGDDLGMQYADSIYNFAKDSEYTLNMVDNLLDILTGGDHSKTVKLLEERRKIKEEEEKMRLSESVGMCTERHEKAVQVLSSSCPDVEPLHSLTDIDLEMSLLDSTENENFSNKRKTDSDKFGRSDMSHKKCKKMLAQRKAIQQKLDTTSQLLNDLTKVQNDRLSANPPPHLALIQGPSAAENDLADKVTKKLQDIASQVPPSSIVSVEGLRKAMGITFQPVTTADSLQNQRINSSASHIKLGVECDSTVQHDVHMANVSHVGSEQRIHSSESRMHSSDLDSELREFLETGSRVRVCESQPSG